MFILVYRMLTFRNINFSFYLSKVLSKHQVVNIVLTEFWFKTYLQTTKSELRNSTSKMSTKNPVHSLNVGLKTQKTPCFFPPKIKHSYHMQIQFKLGARFLCTRCSSHWPNQTFIFRKKNKIKKFKARISISNNQSYISTFTKL